MGEIPLYGQKPSIPSWGAYLLQAEFLWAVFFVIGIALCLGRMVHFGDAWTAGALGLVAGVVIVPGIRVMVRWTLRRASLWVYSNIGPPPIGYR